MGVFNGSISVTKFFVEGAPPKKFAESFVKNLRLRTFQELTIDGEEEETSGWCAAGNGLDLDLTHEKVFLNAYLVLALRVDRWRIPRPLFKAQFDVAQAEYRARTGKDKLSKRDKDELKFRVNRRLRRKVIPVMRVFDLSWDLNRGEVWFWNRSARVNEDMAELFQRTFSLTLTEAAPYVVGQRVLGEERAEQMVSLEPSLFASAESAE